MRSAGLTTADVVTDLRSNRDPRAAGERADDFDSRLERPRQPGNPFCIASAGGEMEKTRTSARQSKGRGGGLLKACVELGKPRKDLAGRPLESVHQHPMVWRQGGPQRGGQLENSLATAEIGRRNRLVDPSRLARLTPGRNHQHEPAGAKPRQRLNALASSTHESTARGEQEGHVAAELSRDAA
jgi:hypothetical protein